MLQVKPCARWWCSPSCLRITSTDWRCLFTYTLETRGRSCASSLCLPPRAAARSPTSTTACRRSACDSSWRCTLWVRMHVGWCGLQWNSIWRYSTVQKSWPASKFPLTLPGRWEIRVGSGFSPFLLHTVHTFLSLFYLSRFKDPLHTTPRYAMFSANLSVGIALLLQKYYFYADHTVICNLFFLDSAKEMKTRMLLTQIQLKFGSLPSGVIHE